MKKGFYNFLSKHSFLVVFSIIVGILFLIYFFFFVLLLSAPEPEYEIGIQVYNSNDELVYKTGSSSVVSYEYIGNTNILRIELVDYYDPVVELWYNKYVEVDVADCIVIYDGKRIR